MPLRAGERRLADQQEESGEGEGQSSSEIHARLRSNRTAKAECRDKSLLSHCECITCSDKPRHKSELCDCVHLLHSDTPRVYPEERIENISNKSALLWQCVPFTVTCRSIEHRVRTNSRADDGRSDVLSQLKAAAEPQKRLPQVPPA
jgi:hypothetical protein